VLTSEDDPVRSLGRGQRYERNASLADIGAVGGRLGRLRDFANRRLSRREALTAGGRKCE